MSLKNFIQVTMVVLLLQFISVQRQVLGQRAASHGMQTIDDAYMGIDRSDEKRFIADVDGDGLDDIIAINSQGVFVSLILPTIGRQ